MEAQLDGLTPGKHGWSVNTYGDLTRGAASTGGHYNPTGASHGAPDSAVRPVLASNILLGYGQVSLSSCDMSARQGLMWIRAC